MVWVYSPKLFFVFSKMLTDKPWSKRILWYWHISVISNILATSSPSPPHTRESLSHIDCYMDDSIRMVQVGTRRQHGVFDGTVCDLKCIILSLLRDTKDSVINKNTWWGRTTGYTSRRSWSGWYTWRLEFSLSQSNFLGYIIPFVNSVNSTPRWSEESRAIGGEATLHASCPTPTPYHTWDIPGHLGLHKGHTLLIIESWSHFRVQPQMQLCIQLCARVNKILSPYQLTCTLLLVHWIQHRSLFR